MGLEYRETAFSPLQYLSDLQAASYSKIAIELQEDLLLRHEPGKALFFCLFVCLFLFLFCFFALFCF